MTIRQRSAVRPSLDLCEEQLCTNIGWRQPAVSKPVLKMASSVTCSNAELLSLLECPVCYDVMRPPIMHCLNSHDVSGIYAETVTFSEKGVCILGLIVTEVFKSRLATRLQDTFDLVHELLRAGTRTDVLDGETVVVVFKF
uniref:(California timema) hypothetical protein n=1 Tax=Timema californicum TaxID=61474 RepID=A0A7R9PA77_TIMCA|nr:unnamed protein product [Timema californicum]